MFQLKRPAHVIACALAAGALAATLGACTVQSAQSSGTQSQASSQAGSAQSSSAKATSNVQHTFVDVLPDESGTITIDESQIGDVATFYNYDANGTTVQLIGIRGSDGTAHLALNTCQSCNPSPNAYYVQQDDTLICRNCGQEFSAADVGAQASGCNPTPIKGLTEQNGWFMVSADNLNAYASNFAKWAGPTKA